MDERQRLELQTIRALMNDLMDFVLNNNLSAMDVRELKRFAAQYSEGETKRNLLIDFVYRLSLGVKR